jgi:uncharacterized protein
MHYLNSEKGDHVIIEIVDETDSICSPCPSRRYKNCVSQKKILRLDQAHADILEIKSGEKITWGDAKMKIHKNMTLQKFHIACAPCEWRKLGICESVVIDMNGEN